MMTRTLIGREEMQACRSAWEELSRASDSPVFQTYAWGRAWLESVGVDYEPWLIVAGDPPRAVLPLAFRRRAGLRTLALLGHGVSDYLGPVTPEPGLGGTLAHALLEESRRVDLVNLRGLSTDAPAVASFVEELSPTSVRRDYERCPAIDTDQTWEAYLKTRKTKFRTNLKRTFRKVEQLGGVAVQIEPWSTGLFEEMLEVERASWKWNNGLAYTRNPATRELLRSALSDPSLQSEVWTCRIDARLAGFCVAFPTARARHYYLPSYREDSWGVGTYLLAAIVEESCESKCEEFDFLQGDEAYKFPWATHERSVLELIMAGGRPLGNIARATIELRWWIARSERLRELRGRVLAVRSRLRRG